MDRLTTSRRGRPRLPDDQKTEPVTVRLPGRLHDQACREASKRGVSVSRVVRVALVRLVNELT